MYGSCQQHQLLGYVFGGGFSKGYGLCEISGIIYNDQNVFVAPGGLQQTHEVHVHLLNGDSDDRQQDERLKGQLVRRGTLTFSGQSRPTSQEHKMIEN